MADNDEVEHLKHLIAMVHQERMRSSAMRLLFNGKVLPDSGTMREHGVQDGDSVRLVILRHAPGANLQIAGQPREQPPNDQLRRGAPRAQLHRRNNNTQRNSAAAGPGTNPDFEEASWWSDYSCNPTPDGYFNQEPPKPCSEENIENQVSMAAALETLFNSWDKKKGKEHAAAEECAICSIEFEPEMDGGSLPCPSGHVMCGDCSSVFVISSLADPLANLPPKCSLCRGEIASCRFEALLSDEQCTQYLTWLAMTTLEAGERLVHCTKCPYFEIRGDTPSLFFCSRCGEGHCYFCKSSLPIVNSDDEDDGFEDGSKQAEIAEHFACGVLAKNLALIEGALESGEKMPCPGCGLSGRKDDACTHMTCNGCGCRWCYCCGRSEADCDKAPVGSSDDSDPIYRHNGDWESNDLRCPMYLSQIGELDRDWPSSNDDECVSRFHRLRTIKLLQESVKAMGVQQYRDLCERFPSVRNCGFSLAEIQNTDTTMFHRRPIQDDESD
eukprot:TRINITY_DN93801_c0_g1_i1.p1 TRINITY_DN93801_c0_g1~~TRINITY_DN93801_c0_g1_i1.p1  ORF type:complete len:531 (+),score=86.31 TRINITY_DN93801_c0_g1_i1:101-1594(+)